MLASMMLALEMMLWGAAYPGPVQPCNIELTGGKIFIGAPFLDAATALKAAEQKDSRVVHPDASHWEWNYHVRTHELLRRESASDKPQVMNVRCEALETAGRRAWVSEGGEDVPAATLVCTLHSKFKNGERALTIALSADLTVLAAKQLWRKEEGTVLCHLPRKPPSNTMGE